MKGKNNSILGSWLIGSVVMPLYYCCKNVIYFNVLDTFYLIFLLSTIHFSLFGLLKLILKNTSKVSFFMYIFWGGFYFSVPVGAFIKYDLLMKFSTGHFIFLENHKWSIFFFCAFIVSVLLFITIKHVGNVAERVLKFLNTFSFIIFIIIVLNLSWTVFKNQKIVHKKIDNQQKFNKQYPNIYHILLDAHPNLKAAKIIGGDLKYLYKELEDLGFITYPDSKSNYPGTSQSVSSMLMMDYFQGDEMLKTDQQIHRIIESSKVFERLSCYYNIFINTSSPIIIDWMYPETLIETGQAEWIRLIDILASIQPFQSIMYHFFNSSYKALELKIMHNICSQLSVKTKTCGFSNNMFYTHILCPHRPIIYDVEHFLTNSNFYCAKVEDPSPFMAPEFYANFVKNTFGIDCEILAALKEILKDYRGRSPQPVIILHSDHSILHTLLSEKNTAPTPYFNQETLYGNLFAIYMPDEWKKDAKDLTFINLYRFIFNHLFDTHYPYLENKQIYRGKPSELPKDLKL